MKKNNIFFIGITFVLNILPSDQKAPALAQHNQTQVKQAHLNDLLCCQDHQCSLVCTKFPAGYAFHIQLKIHFLKCAHGTAKTITISENRAHELSVHQEKSTKHNSQKSNFEMTQDAKSLFERIKKEMAQHGDMDCKKTWTKKFKIVDGQLVAANA